MRSVRKAYVEDLVIYHHKRALYSLTFVNSFIMKGHGGVENEVQDRNRCRRYIY
jgi:hypothetical protein